jgi:Uri superfamily endonuclease
VPSTSDDSGLYVILMNITRPVGVTWARQSALLDSGLYAYVGSARRTLRARVERHLRRKKPKKWHVDQLTTHRSVTISGAILVPQATMTEHELNMIVGSAVDGTTPAPRFGAADCRAGCPAHLWRSGQSEGADQLARLLEVRLPGAVLIVVPADRVAVMAFARPKAVSPAPEMASSPRRRPS